MEPVNCTASELSTFLRALGEGYFPTYFSGTNPCVPSRSMTIASKSSVKGKRTVTFLGSRFSMTLQPSTGNLGGATSMSSAEDSPASPSALQGDSAGKMIHEICGPTRPASLAKYDHNSRSWKTSPDLRLPNDSWLSVLKKYGSLAFLARTIRTRSQGESVVSSSPLSELATSGEYSGTYPKWGTMRNGELWERTTPVLRIEGKGSGYWPTPTSQNAKHGAATDWEKANRPRHLHVLAANTPSGNWPTPTCADAFTDKLKSDQQKEGSMHSVNPSQAVKMWPTPITRDAITSGFKIERIVADAETRQDSLTRVTALEAQATGGQLNPDWVELLMGWPRGWSAIGDQDGRTAFRAWLRASQIASIASRPSATDKSQPPPPLPGIPSTNGSNADAA